MSSHEMCRFSLRTKRYEMTHEQCPNCNHDSDKAHSVKNCGCGCASFQPVNAPVAFNSVMSGEEISQQIERLRRILADANNLDTDL